jgi:polar amino acid transport system substrate-binding protein
MKTSRIALALAVLTALSLPLWSQAKTYTFGSDATFPPMEFVDAATKNVVGFDVDMINAIAKARGFRPWSRAPPGTASSPASPPATTTASSPP